jgi:hypothetical protein
VEIKDRTHTPKKLIENKDYRDKRKLENATSNHPTKKRNKWASSII